MDLGIMKAYVVVFLVDSLAIYDSMDISNSFTMFLCKSLNFLVPELESFLNGLLEFDLFLLSNLLHVLLCSCIHFLLFLVTTSGRDDSNLNILPAWVLKSTGCAS